ncbi:MAG: hypothetical protein Q8N63_07975 [Nanoarchaeota archaeon]|nr:hypothetical protein [Nanoarchaeota archaeon]
MKKEKLDEEQENKEEESESDEDFRQSEPEIIIPESLEINLNETEAIAEPREREGIEDIVSSNSQDIPMSSQFAPRQFVSEQNIPIPQAPEKRPIPNRENRENKENRENFGDEFSEVQTMPFQTAGEEAKPHQSSKYSQDYYQPREDYPKVMHPTNPTLDQDLSRVQQFNTRLTQSDAGWNVKNTNEDWEKKYEAKFADSRREKRRF